MNVNVEFVVENLLHKVILQTKEFVMSADAHNKVR